jgi:hypothetical protein
VEHNHSLQLPLVGTRGQTKEGRKIINNERNFNTSVEPAAKVTINFVEERD